MQKIWSDSERLEIINAIAFIGMSAVDSYYFILIGLVVTATPEFLNSDKEISQISQDVENLKNKLGKDVESDKIPITRTCKMCAQAVCDCSET